MARKLAAKTRFDREQDQEDARLLYFAGNHSLAECARIVGVTEDAVRQWSSRGAWAKQPARIKELANKPSRSVTPAENAAVLFAQRGANIKNKASRSAERVFDYLADEEKAPTELVLAAAKSAASWMQVANVAHRFNDDGQGNRFAVAINIAQLANDPTQVRELTDDELRELEAEGLLDETSRMPPLVD